MYWVDKKADFLKRPRAEYAVQEAMKRKTAVYDQVEYDLNNILFNNCVSRRVRQVNELFGRSVQSSETGQAMIKGLVVINLMREIPAYAEAYDKEGWEGLAVEFFRRRVPLGSALENVMMARYQEAVWDTVTVFLPPVALGRAAVNLGQYFGTLGWQEYWSSELGYFYDELYSKAEFNLRGVEEFDDVDLGVRRTHGRRAEADEVLGGRRLLGVRPGRQERIHADLEHYGRDSGEHRAIA